MNLPSKLSELLTEVRRTDNILLLERAVLERAVLEASGGTAPPFTPFDAKLLPPMPPNASAKMHRYWATYCNLLLEEHLEAMKAVHAAIQRESAAVVLRGGKKTRAGRA